MNLEDEAIIINRIKKNNALKEKIINKLDILTKTTSSLLDINTNIYCQNNYISLSPNNCVEKILKEYIKYNEFLLFDKKKDNSDIIKLYKEITGISVSRTNELNLKIRFDFLCEKNEYYIILSYDNDKNTKSNYEVISIYPEGINYKIYLEELNRTQDISLFLCKLINYELIPFYEKEK